MSVNKYDATTDTLTKVAGNATVPIDDTTASADKVYSSAKVESVVSNYPKVITLNTIDEFKSFTSSLTDVGVYMMNFPVGSQELVSYITDGVATASTGGIGTVKKSATGVIDFDMMLYNGAMSISCVRYHVETETFQTLRFISNEYSTDEKAIGTWVDGKPIYRKVINFDTSKSITGSGSQVATISENAVLVNAHFLYSNQIINHIKVANSRGSLTATLPFSGTQGVSTLVVEYYYAD